MDRKRIILIKTNLIDFDPRLIKDVKALKHGGYEVTLLCWDRDCETPRPKQGEKARGYRQIRVRFKAPTGIKILPFLPIWWCFELFWLMVERWDIVHARNFVEACSWQNITDEFEKILQKAIQKKRTGLSAGR